jgi:hypothetical protein
MESRKKVGGQAISTRRRLPELCKDFPKYLKICRL